MVIVNYDLMSCRLQECLFDNLEGTLDQMKICIWVYFTTLQLAQYIVHEQLAFSNTNSEFTKNVWSVGFSDKKNAYSENMSEYISMFSSINLS